MAANGMTRRGLVGAGLGGAALLVGARTALARDGRAWERVLDFGALPDGDGWPGWSCPGVANLRRAGGRGLLEAGSDVFPCDPRPVAFAVDQRFVDGAVTALFDAGGAGAGLVLRRVAPRAYYAAVLDDEQAALVLLRRSPEGVEVLRRAPVVRPGGAFRLTLRARGTAPTSLTAVLETAGGAAVTAAAADDAAPLQRAGDPGLLATARTLLPSQGPAVLPALGNLHLLPYGVQEGQAVLDTGAGGVLIDEIRRRSTAVVREVAVHADGAPGLTRPSVVAATTGAPVAGGAWLRVATDVRARVQIEVAREPSFRRSRRTPWQLGDGFAAVLRAVDGLPAGEWVHWRPRVRRRGRVHVGPAQSFRVLPAAGSGDHVRVAIGSCAAQFGPAFAEVRDRRPDVFLWQGDLNYPDTIGPLAQTVPGYAGIWRDFLANPLLEPLLGRTAFAAQRDDHDYGLQDANATNLVPWGLAPWEGLVERRLHFRFAAGLAEFWVLDQRRHKSDPSLPDTPDKTLLGAAQRAWLLRTLAASRAPFKVVCSPCTLAGVGVNQRDGSWAAGFRAERDLLLAHIERHVGGRTLFVTGDTHWTMAYERDGLLEVRPCPMGIPTPNDVTVTDPQAAEAARRLAGVAYADDDRGHIAIVDVRRQDGRPRLDVTLVREDGAQPWRRTLWV
ncbi:MAG TPA: alkaline phosphatase D family protein [Baekduia sp.]|nr:alkaline phosphatase D family protein [Baekduia sp.]